ncbi:S-layer homology domain-containing protein [Thermincola ferriacetica]
MLIFDICCQSPSKYHLFSRFFSVLTDLQPGHSSYAPVSSMVARGYMRGYPDSRFLTDRKKTRAEFLPVGSRILQEKMPGGEYRQGGSCSGP